MMGIVHLWRSAILATAIATLAGCGQHPGTGADSNAPRLSLSADRIGIRPGVTASAIKSGFAALSQGDYAGANRVFGQALARDPRNAALHALNAVTYHIRYRAGERDLFELAETGYRAALENQADFALAARQLARLYFEHGDFKRAKATALYAATLEPEDTEAQALAAASAYHSGDLPLALWALGKGREQAPSDPALARMTPIIYGASGLTELAAGALPAVTDAGEARRLARRLSQWQNFHQSAQAEAEPPPPEAAPRDEVAKEIDLSAPPPLAAAVSDQGPVSYSWSDCQQQMAASQAGSYSGNSYNYGTTSAGSDETTALPALPAPCKGRPLPRMAMIDAVMLRTDELQSTGHGINLLDGLTMFVSRSLTSTRSWGSAAGTKTNTVAGTIGIGAAGTGGVLYTLNIFNATNNRAEIIARPSLLALDRQPAQFFSGSTVSVGLVSPLGGSTLQDKPIGVSLSVTPTFIDDDTMLVNVKAARSFFEPLEETSTFAQSLQSSRNMVSASVRMKFDETLILSGLSEREVTTNENRVPLLGDIPVVQNLFSHDERRDFTTSVLILLTPRRVANFGDSLEASSRVYKLFATDDEPEAVREARRTALKELGGVWPNLVTTFSHMDRNKLFKGIRTGDIRLEDWDEPSRLERIMLGVVEMLYR
ncbi:MAG TPA: hypothetical protein VLL76_06395 [Candidatus Omnitrophota bacterium]|nr:hypothetical protein [Candidatus Omnitrophota bacterium]